MGIIEVTIIQIVLVLAVSLFVGMSMGLIIMRHYYGNPVRKLRKDVVYFQGELASSHILLRESSKRAALRLYDIKGAKSKELPEAFVVTEKTAEGYKAIHYDTFFIGRESPEEFPGKLDNKDSEESFDMPLADSLDKPVEVGRG